MVRIARRTLAVIALSVLAHHLNPALAATTAFSSAHCPTRVPSRLYSTVMSDNTTNPSSPAFLQDKISTLLASPHIHFNQPPQGAPFRIRMGHGPVDLFSTRFANYFTQDATGVVAGKEVDNDGLKRALLALQKKWNPDEADFVAQDEAEQPTTKLLWKRKDGGHQGAITVSAETKEEGGAHRISRLILDGEESLFSP